MKRTAKICKTCGNVFYLRDCEIKKGRIYCSQKCSSNAPIDGEELQLLRELYPVSTWDDLFRAFPGKSRAALQSQASKFGIKRKVPPKRKPRQGTVIKCEYCGEESYQPPSRANRKFCSQKCSALYHSRENASNWRDGKSKEPYPLEFNEEFKKRIRERDSYTCALCGQYGVHVHHINYAKYDIDPTNCITLCISCHGKTNYNREYWQIKFSELVAYIS